MAEDLGERTELPSQRKLDDAREKGQVAKSADLVAALDLACALVVLAVLGGGLARALARLVKDGLAGGAWSLDGVDYHDVVRTVILPVAVGVAPAIGAMILIALAGNVGQTGPLLTLEPLRPKFDRLNPVAGLGRIFGKKNAVKSLISIVKFGLVVWVSWLILGASFGGVATLPRLELWHGVAALGALMFKLAAWLVALLALIGVIDFMYQRWQHTQDLRMSRREVQDERRSMEGDPLVKGRRMRMMREIAMQQVGRSVPKADVVVTNPTHYSVAIRYDPETMAAPRVVAKGVDFMAMRIRQVAAMHKVPMVERPPLARGLYYGTRAGQEISPEFYQAVAEVLAYVYRLEKEAA